MRTGRSQVIDHILAREAVLTLIHDSPNSGVMMARVDKLIKSGTLVATGFNREREEERYRAVYLA